MRYSFYDFVLFRLEDTRSLDTRYLTRAIKFEWRMDAKDPFALGLRTVHRKPLEFIVTLSSVTDVDI